MGGNMLFEFKKNKSDEKFYSVAMYYAVYRKIWGQGDGQRKKGKKLRLWRKTCQTSSL